jgi:hypothetical protein
MHCVRDSRQLARTSSARSLDELQHGERKNSSRPQVWLSHRASVAPWSPLVAPSFCPGDAHPIGDPLPIGVGGAPIIPDHQVLIWVLVPATIQAELR